MHDNFTKKTPHGLTSGGNIIYYQVFFIQGNHGIAVAPHKGLGHFDTIPLFRATTRKEADMNTPPWFSAGFAVRFPDYRVSSMFFRRGAGTD